MVDVVARPTVDGVILRYVALVDGGRSGEHALVLVAWRCASEGQHSHPLAASLLALLAFLRRMHTVEDLPV